MKKHLGIACALLAVSLTARAAAANVCVRIDTSQDTLTPDEQVPAQAMLEHTLRNQGAPVGRDACTETWTVHHIRLGQSINVYINGPRGFRQGQAARIEELPSVYDQMVRSAISGRPVDATNQTTTRHNVTLQQQTPRRVEADSLWYARLGYGGVIGPNVSSGPALGFGYRYELDHVGIDFSFLNFSFDTDTTDGDSGASGSLVRLQGLWFLNPLGNGSSYLGAGLGWGLAGVADETRSYSGSGLQGELSAGFEFLRASTIRMFVQADLALPFYTLKRDLVSGNDSAWAPIASLALGIAWGRGITRVQVLH